MYLHDDDDDDDDGAKKKQVNENQLSYPSFFIA